MGISLNNGTYTAKSGDMLESVVRQYLPPGTSEATIHADTEKVLATDHNKNGAANAKTYANSNTVGVGDTFDFSVIGAPKSGSGNSSAGSSGGSSSGNTSAGTSSATNATGYYGGNGSGSVPGLLSWGYHQGQNSGFSDALDGLDGSKYWSYTGA